MAYNVTNRLKRIVDIQNITLEHTAKGVTQEYVYQELIWPVYRISRRTYYSYLGYNAKAHLTRLRKEREKQLAMF